VGVKIDGNFRFRDFLAMSIFTVVVIYSDSLLLSRYFAMSMAWKL
jgi:hypothetical protein